MKSILIFFFIVSVGLGAGVYFYETQIASPNAADALVKAKKKKAVVKPELIVKKPSPLIAKIEDTITEPVKQSRVVDLLDPDKSGTKISKERVKKHREIEKLIQNTIKKSVTVDIQKAVVTELSKQR